MYTTGWCYFVDKRRDIQSTWTDSSTTSSKGCGLLRWLHDLDFMNKLFKFLNNVLFHSEILYNSLQSVGSDALYVNNAIEKNCQCHWKGENTYSCTDWKHSVFVKNFIIVSSNIYLQLTMSITLDESGIVSPQ